MKLEALRESIVEFEEKGLGNANVSDLSGCWELVWSSLIPGVSMFFKISIHNISGYYSLSYSVL